MQKEVREVWRLGGIRSVRSGQSAHLLLRYMNQNRQGDVLTLWPKRSQCVSDDKHTIIEKASSHQPHFQGWVIPWKPAHLLLQQLKHPTLCVPNIWWSSVTAPVSAPTLLQTDPMGHYKPIRAATADKHFPPNNRTCKMWPHCLAPPNQKAIKTISEPRYMYHSASIQRYARNKIYDIGCSHEQAHAFFKESNVEHLRLHTWSQPTNKATCKPTSDFDLVLRVQLPSVGLALSMPFFTWCRAEKRQTWEGEETATNWG